MTLTPVGMEALIEVAMGADSVSMLCGAGIVNILTPARTPYAPSATLECAEVIAMRVLGHSAVVGNYLCLWVTELLSSGFPNIVNPPLLYFF